jgi:hypothetical protein
MSENQNSKKPAVPVRQVKFGRFTVRVHKVAEGEVVGGRLEVVRSGHVVRHAKYDWLRGAVRAFDRLNNTATAKEAAEKIEWAEGAINFDLFAKVGEATSKAVKTAKPTKPTKPTKTKVEAHVGIVEAELGVAAVEAAMEIAVAKQAAPAEAAKIAEVVEV